MDGGTRSRASEFGMLGMAYDQATVYSNLICL